MVPYDTNFVIDWSKRRFLRKKMESEVNLRFIYLSTYPKRKNISEDSLIKIRLKIGDKKLGTVFRLDNPIFIGQKDCYTRSSSYHGPLWSGESILHLKKKKGRWKYHCSFMEMVS